MPDALTTEELTHPIAESYVRERQWEALEELLALVPPGGTWHEVVYLPAPLARRAMRCVGFLGWLSVEEP